MYLFVLIDFTIFYKSIVCRGWTEGTKLIIYIGIKLIRYVISISVFSPMCRPCCGFEPVIYFPHPDTCNHRIHFWPKKAFNSNVIFQRFFACFRCNLALIILPLLSFVSMHLNMLNGQNGVVRLSVTTSSNYKKLLK